MTKLTQAQEQAIAYIQKAIIAIDELDVDLPEELTSELRNAQRKWMRIHEDSIELVREYEGGAKAGKELIDELFFAAERGSEQKDALMLVSDRVDSGEY